MVRAGTVHICVTVADFSFNRLGLGGGIGNHYYCSLRDLRGLFWNALSPLSHKCSSTVFRCRF